jgi:predicted Zn-dependent protease
MSLLKTMKYPRIFYIALLLVTLFATSCIRKRDYVPIDKKNLRGSGKLYLVPLGKFPKSSADELASFYRAKYGIDAETLPTVHLGPSTINPEREQLMAEEAVDVMTRVNQEITNDPKAIMIGLTSEDMYITKYDWQFSFSWRARGKYAVVSSGRMSLGRRVTEDQIRTRLRKMVTKNVGVLYFHLPQSDDPRSVLYRNVGGIRDLDYMGEEF